MKEEIYKTIVEILIENNAPIDENIEISEVADTLKKIGGEIDSLTYISFLVSLEQRYGVDLPEEVLVDNVFENIDGIVEYICKNK